MFTLFFVGFVYEERGGEGNFLCSLLFHFIMLLLVLGGAVVPQGR